MKRIVYALVILFIACSLSLAQTVYVTKTGSKYHSSGCSYLKKSSTPIDIKDAVGKGYTPCSKCNPGSPGTVQTDAEVKEDTSPPTTTTKSQLKNNSSTRIRCQAITKKGKQCKRWVQAGSDYCWQHQK